MPDRMIRSAVFTLNMWSFLSIISQSYSYRVRFHPLFFILSSYITNTQVAIGGKSTQHSNHDDSTTKHPPTLGLENGSETPSHGTAVSCYPLPSGFHSRPPYSSPVVESSTITGDTDDQVVCFSPTSDITFVVAIGNAQDYCKPIDPSPWVDSVRRTQAKKTTSCALMLQHQLRSFGREHPLREVVVLGYSLKVEHFLSTTYDGDEVVGDDLVLEDLNDVSWAGEQQRFPLHLVEVSAPKLAAALTTVFCWEPRPSFSGLAAHCRNRGEGRLAEMVTKGKGGVLGSNYNTTHDFLSHMFETTTRKYEQLFQSGGRGRVLSVIESSSVAGVINDVDQNIYVGLILSAVFLAVRTKTFFWADADMFLWDHDRARETTKAATSNAGASDQGSDLQSSVHTARYPSWLDIALRGLNDGSLVAVARNTEFDGTVWDLRDDLQDPWVSLLFHPVYGGLGRNLWQRTQGVQPAQVQGRAASSASRSTVRSTSSSDSMAPSSLKEDDAAGVAWLLGRTSMAPSSLKEDDAAIGSGTITFTIRSHFRSRIFLGNAASLVSRLAGLEESARAKSVFDSFEEVMDEHVCRPREVLAAASDDQLDTALSRGRSSEEEKSAHYSEGGRFSEDRPEDLTRAFGAAGRPAFRHIATLGRQDRPEHLKNPQGGCQTLCGALFALQRVKSAPQRKMPFPEPNWRPGPGPEPANERSATQASPCPINTSCNTL